MNTKSEIDRLLKKAAEVFKNQSFDNSDYDPSDDDLIDFLEVGVSIERNNVLMFIRIINCTLTNSVFNTYLMHEDLSSEKPTLSACFKELHKKLDELQESFKKCPTCGK